MPANLSTLNIATASSETLLKALAREGCTPRVQGEPGGFTASAWCPHRVQANGETPVKALRKLCRAVKAELKKGATT